MNTISKMLLAGLFSLTMLTAMAQQPRHVEAPDAASGATMVAEREGQPAPEERPQHGCMMPGMMQAVDFQSVKICFAPQMDAFIAVDSVECCIHMVRFTEDGRDTVVASFKTDDTYKRHDLKNILRPVSVGVMGPYVVVLASAVNDTAYVALLDQELNEVARRPFNSPMYAMHMGQGRLMVVGRNPYGYDVNIIPFKCPGSLAETLADGEIMTHHYRVAKQSEKIKESDPVGIGLTAVAVAVVFLALVCIALIISGSGKLIVNADKRRKEKGEREKKRAIKPVSDGTSSQTEVMAAIAAAIHLYNDELHDEENTVITIQKVKRDWTPWNAKYYNMNHYFNRK